MAKRLVAPAWLLDPRPYLLVSPFLGSGFDNDHIEVSWGATTFTAPPATLSALDLAPALGDSVSALDSNGHYFN